MRTMNPSDENSVVKSGGDNESLVVTGRDICSNPWRMMSPGEG